MLDEDPILDPENVRRDPVHGCPEPRKPPMNDDEVAIGHDRPGIVFQRRRHALDEVEEALAARSDVRAVLDVGGRPVALSRDVVSLVEQGIEGLEDECLIPLLFRLTHRFAPPSTGMLAPVIHRAPSDATNAITSATSDGSAMYPPIRATSQSAGTASGR